MLSVEQCDKYIEWGIKHKNGEPACRPTLEDQLEFLFNTLIKIIPEGRRDCAVYVGRNFRTGLYEMSWQGYLPEIIHHYWEDTSDKDQTSPDPQKTVFKLQEYIEGVK